MQALGVNLVVLPQLAALNLYRSQLSWYRLEVRLKFTSPHGWMDVIVQSFGRSSGRSFPLWHAAQGDLIKEKTVTVDATGMSLHMGESRAGPAGGNNYSRPEGQNVRAGVHALGF